ncbi:MAG: anaerobic carbon-monoxide dehydrogenase catalytic subunit, partial [Chloroflexota bacterium]
MFCYQCEQTAQGKGCTALGVCGKDPETAALQDLLMHAAKGLAMYAHRTRRLGVSDPEIDAFTIKALFTTVTNVNFDPSRLEGLLREAAILKDRARRLYAEASLRADMTAEALGGPAAWVPAADRDGLVRQGLAVGIDKRQQALGEDLAGLQELVAYGLKGMAAYAEHASALGQEDASVYAFVHEALDALTVPNPTAASLTALALKVGKVNLKVMELLDRANTGAYGNPVPTPVRIDPVRGKAILVSGHDLKDLEELLKQTEGTGINVY